MGQLAASSKFLRLDSTHIADSFYFEDSKLRSQAVEDSEEVVKEAYDASCGQRRSNGCPA